MVRLHGLEGFTRERAGRSESLRPVANTPRLARSGFTHPFGKLDDDPIQAFKVPRVVKTRLQEQAAEAGLPFHEYLREIVTIAAMGSGAVKDAYAARVDAIAKTLKE